MSGATTPASPSKPRRPHQFRVKEFQDVVILFTVEGGKVVAMRQRDPSGEFLLPRVQWMHRA